MLKISTQDYRYVLDDAKELLDEIILSYRDYFKSDEVPRSLMNKIRFFLLNVESALDYIAFDVFTIHCLPKITEKIEWRKSKVNFPLLDEKPKFDKRMKLMFQEIISERPDIIQVFEKCQPFNTGRDYWLPIFNRLVNNSKHRELEKQRISTTTQVHHMNLLGNTFINCTFSNNGTDININGQAINFRDYQPNPYINSLNATVQVDFIFKDLNRSVIPTLTEIYDGASSVINELESAIEGI